MSDSTELDILALYHQFYLMDADQTPPYPETITNDHIAQGFQEAPHIVAVYTVTDETVHISIRIESDGSDERSGDWQRRFECGLELPSGKLLIAGIDDYLPDCRTFAVPLGTYRVRVRSRGPMEGRPEEYAIRLFHLCESG